jgi:hypothetical protein
MVTKGDRSVYFAGLAEKHHLCATGILAARYQGLKLKVLHHDLFGAKRAKTAVRSSAPRMIANQDDPPSSNSQEHSIRRLARRLSIRADHWIVVTRLFLYCDLPPHRPRGG